MSSTGPLPFLIVLKHMKASWNILLIYSQCSLVVHSVLVTVSWYTVWTEFSV